ncbi:Uncharacterised protein [Legionella israelensis]|nr:hypothetical protein SAMN02746069_01433 [Legionella israelensis DSM 19235]STX59261.1 Uncharacterised protein [Legionella israelensis]
MNSFDLKLIHFQLAFIIWLKMVEEEEYIVKLKKLTQKLL